ncbi:MAG: hypothetical protein JWO38_6017 [Gemmataceae bacterium]|nr:hypothetical protein [Gemmataceae bacterium]
MLFFLLAGHALMDFALQTDPMAVCKCRRSNHPLQQAVPWYYWLTAHALLHGAAVGFLLRWGYDDWYLAVWFAVAETVTHWLIDFGKCEKLYSIHIDQGLHVLCKVAWWGLVAGRVVQSPPGS